MNERKLHRLFQRVLLLAAPLPAIAAGTACSSGATPSPCEAASCTGPAGPPDSSSDGPSSASDAETSEDVMGDHASTMTADGKAEAEASAAEGGTDGALSDGALSEGALSDVGSDTMTPVDSCGGDAGAVGPGLCRATCVVPDASIAAFTAGDGGIVRGQTCADFCGPTFGVGLASCTLIDAGPQQPLVKCSPDCTGRRPAGMRESAASRGSAIGVYFAEAELLEAASVDAFRILRDELRYHRAPRALVAAAQRASRDEIKHARMTGALARRYGASRAAAHVPRGPVRSLEEMAIENAREGCVRETFGALTATYQSIAANDPVVRPIMKKIARDETSHAALAWRVAAWLDGRLDAAARQRVRDARRAAAREVAAAARRQPPTDLIATAGLPRADVATAMAERMNELWS